MHTCVFEVQWIDLLVASSGEDKLMLGYWLLRLYSLSFTMKAEFNLLSLILQVMKSV